ncbi:MAG: hypothetical protein GY778_11040 [bacterium]|nr:hypothetical protein [bacterium]
MIGSSVVAIIVIVGGWLVLHHIPAWYRPVTVAPGQVQLVRDSLTGAFQGISERMVARPRAEFEASFSQQTINEWLAVRGQIWPDSEEWIPPWLRDPMIAFEPGRVILAAHFDREGWEAIVAVHLSVTAADDRVTARVERVSCGALPVPMSLLGAPLADLVDSNRLDVPAMPDELANTVRKVQGAEIGALLTEGLTFEGPFIWKNGDRPYHITDLRLERGRLTLTIDPL